MSKLYLFDLDDTIVNHSEAMGSALFALTSLLPKGSSGYEDVWTEQTKKYWKLFEQGSMSFDEQRRNRIQSFFSHFGKNLSITELGKIDRVYLFSYERALKTNKLAKLLIKELKKKNEKIGILTNGNGEQQRRKLKKTKLLPYIDPNLIFISEEIGLAKPNPEIYKYVEKKTKHSGKEILFISDSWDSDLEPASKNNWEVMLWKGGKSLFQ